MDAQQIPAIRAAVREYLSRCFPGHRVSEHPEKVPDLVFRLEQGDRAYQLRLMSEVWEGRSPDDVISALDAWRVSEELCRAESLPLVVSSNGVRLESNN